LSFRKAILGLTLSLVFVMYILCSFAVADTTVDNYVPFQQSSWINPIYANHLDVFNQQSRQAQAVANSVTISNLDGLRVALRQSFNQRETVLTYIYTGASSDITGESITSLINSVLDEDDYRKFSFGGWEAGWGGYEGSMQIDLTVSYLTTLDNENYVNEQVTQILSEILDPVMNEDQIEKAIHDYIILNVAYDTTYTEHSAYAALFGGKTVCQGYALLAYKMLTQAGLQARIIGGYGSGESHAWNMVRVNNNWYNLDCTWDDPIPDRPGEVQYDYYNLNDTEMLVEHTPDPGTYPTASTSYFQALTTLIQSSTDQADIYQRLRQQLYLDYLLSAKTAINATELETKWLASAQHHDSKFMVRFYDPNNSLTTIRSAMFSRISANTDLTRYSMLYSPYSHGGSDYLLLEFILTYSTSNQVPAVSGVTISGSPQPGQKLTGIYQYSDAESDPEGLSIYQWYRGSLAAGADKTEIPGAIGRYYTISNSDLGDYLFFSVQPIAAWGTLSGTASSISAGTLVQTVVQTQYVSAIPTISDIQVALGTARTSLNLPSAAQVTLSNGNQISCNINWDNGSPSYNDNQTGTYTFSGNLLLPTGVDNPSNLKASVKVIVKNVVGESRARLCVDAINNNVPLSQFFAASLAGDQVKTCIQTGCENSNLADSFALSSLVSLLVNLNHTCSIDSITIQGNTFYYNDLISNTSSTISAIRQSVIALTGKTKYEDIVLKDLAGHSITVSLNGTPVIISMEQNDQCFIATAAFGSKYSWPVALLRHFRDQYLLTNSLGSAFVKFYYLHSPPLAAYIVGKAWLKQLVRVVLAPLVAAVYLLYHPGCLFWLFALIALLIIYRRQYRRSLAGQ